MYDLWGVSVTACAIWDFRNTFTLVSINVVGENLSYPDTKDRNYNDRVATQKCKM